MLITEYYTNPSGADIRVIRSSEGYYIKCIETEQLYEFVEDEVDSGLTYVETNTPIKTKPMMEPATEGNAGDVLKTDGDGGRYWAPGGSAGADGELYVTGLSVDVHQGSTVIESTDDISVVADVITVVATLSNDKSFELEYGEYEITGALNKGTCHLTCEYFGLSSEQFDIEVVGPYVGYDSVGSPNVVNGILMPNSETTNYIKCPYEFNPGNADWEIGIKVNSVSNNGYQDLLGFEIGEGASATLVRSVCIQTGNHSASDGVYNVANGFLSNIGTGGISWNISAGQPRGKVEYGEDIYIKLYYDSEGYHMRTSSDGVTWESYSYESAQPDVSSSTDVASGGYFALGRKWLSQGAYWKGTIDLRETYIKIDGELWWKAA